MYASTVFIALVAAVSAAPHRPNVNNHVYNHLNHEVKTVSVQEVGDVCGNNNTIHCCNSESNDNAVGGLLGLDLSNVLSGCQDITVQVISLLLGSRDTCNMQTVCCGETVQNGLVNVGCLPLNIL